MSGALLTIDSPGLELVIPAGLLLAAVLPFLRQATRLQIVGLVVLPLALTAGLGFVKYTMDSRNDASRAALLASTPTQTRLRPVTAPNNAYTSSQTCRACHPSEYKSWHNSYHSTMTQLAKSGAILAKWHGTRLPLGQAALQLEQKRDEFWVNTVGADGIKTDSQRVTMTTGSHHLQVYWTADANGNLQHPFPFGWLIADQKWVPVQDTFLRDPHLAAPDAKWNNVCIKCHAVAGRPGIDARTRTVNTETAELGISCEACHGPAKAHIAHYQNPANRYATHLGNKPAHAILNPGSETLDHRLSAQACGQCHSYQSQSQAQKIDWNKNGPRFLPGQNLKPRVAVVHASNFIADKNPGTPAELKAFVATHKHLPLGRGDLLDRFWPDGMVRVTGREYNGLLDTACFQRGKMSCLSCHSMHGYHDKNDQLAPRMETNDACLQCHDDLRENLTSHTHHAANSAGSLCYNCHMPHTTYGLLNSIRSHQDRLAQCRDTIEDRPPQRLQPLPPRPHPRVDQPALGQVVRPPPTAARQRRQNHLIDTQAAAQGRRRPTRHRRLAHGLGTSAQRRRRRLAGSVAAPRDGRSIRRRSIHRPQGADGRSRLRRHAV